MVFVAKCSLCRALIKLGIRATKKSCLAWTAIDRLSVVWRSDLTDKMKCSFFQAAVVSILLYGCTTWTLTKRMEKKLDGNYTRILWAILNKSWRQHPTKMQLYVHLPPITKTTKIRWTRHAGNCWRSRDELISDVLLWTPSHGQAKAGRPARTYIQHLCPVTGCSPEDLPKARDDGEGWQRGPEISVLIARHDYDEKVLDKNHLWKRVTRYLWIKKVNPWILGKMQKNQH